MAENQGENPYVCEMRFAGEDGVLVHVRIESPREGLRSAAIRSAMVNHCSLYPVDRVSPADKESPYAMLVALGFMAVAVTFAAVLGIAGSSGMSYREVLVDPRWRNLVLMPAAFVLVAAPFLLLVEHKHRRFRRNARAISERYAHRQAPAPQPDAPQGPA